jgi:hypothetical protein
MGPTFWSEVHSHPTITTENLVFRTFTLPDDKDFYNARVDLDEDSWIRARKFQKPGINSLWHELAIKTEKFDQTDRLERA